MSNYNYTSVYFNGGRFEFTAFSLAVVIDVPRFETDYYEKWQIPYMLLENHISKSVEATLTSLAVSNPEVVFEVISLGSKKDGSTLLIVEATKDEETVRLFPQINFAHATMMYGAGYTARPTWVHWGLWLPKTEVNGALFKGAFGGLFGMYPTFTQLMYEFERYVSSWTEQNVKLSSGVEEFSTSLNETVTVSDVKYSTYDSLPGVEQVYNQQATELDWKIQIFVSYLTTGNESGVSETKYASQIIPRISRAMHGVGQSTAGWCTMIPRVKSVFPEESTPADGTASPGEPTPEVGENDSPAEPPLVDEDQDFVLPEDIQDDTSEAISPETEGLPDDWFESLKQEVTGLSKRTLYVAGFAAIALLIL